MNSIRTKVHISKPCTESWEAMLPADRGRFCMNCQKTVIDFTSKTDREILEYISGNPNSCGRFYKSQVLLPHEMPKGWFQQCKEYVAAASLVLATKLAVLTPAVAQTTSSVNVTASHPETEEDKPIFAADGNLYLRGTVLDTENEKPLEGVKVSINVRESEKNYREESGNSDNLNTRTAYQVFTNADGKFELVIPAVELGSLQNSLSFQAAGYRFEGWSLSSLNVHQPIVQYLDKMPPPSPRIGPDRSDYSIIQGGAETGYVIIESRWKRKKQYYSRAGFLLAHATIPFWWARRKWEIWRYEKDRY